MPVLRRDVHLRCELCNGRRWRFAHQVRGDAGPLQPDWECSIASAERKACWQAYPHPQLGLQWRVDVST